MTRVLITEGVTRKGLVFARSLHRLGVEVYCAEASRLAMVFWSNCCKAGFLCPPAEDDPQGFLSEILSIVKREKIDLLMPIGHFDTLLISQARDRFEPHCKVAVADFAVIDRLYDKVGNLELATELGLEMPLTFVFEDPAGFEAGLSTIPLPAIIKPRRSSGGRGSRIVFTREQLREAYHQVHAKFPQPIVQELVPSEKGDCGAALVMDRQGRAAAKFVYHRVRDYPIGTGPGSVVESVDAPDLLEMAETFLRRARYTGIGEVEFRYDARDGRPKFLECNARPWGFFTSALDSGVDMAAQWYKIAMDLPYTPIQTYRAGVVNRWLLPADILHFLTSPNRFHLDPPFWKFRGIRLDDFSAADPWPTAANLLWLARQALSPASWKRYLLRSS